MRFTQNEGLTHPPENGGWVSNLTEDDNHLPFSFLLSDYFLYVIEQFSCHRKHLHSDSGYVAVTGVK